MTRYDWRWRGAPYSAWYPGAYWAGAPIFGWGWGIGSPGYGPMWMPRYPDEYRGRVRPEQSPTYGRRGDEAARRYARGHGYDEGYVIRTRRVGYDEGYTDSARGPWRGRGR